MENDEVPGTLKVTESQSKISVIKKADPRIQGNGFFAIK
jgi:hypothetical protein